MGRPPPQIWGGGPFPSPLGLRLCLAACRCDFSVCKCDRLRRVPVQEQPFLTDQRGQRMMYIGSVDIVTTSKMKRRLHRRSIVEDKIANNSKSAEPQP